MQTFWYVIKVLPGKERSLNEDFNKQISLGKINNITRFICPTEKEYVVVKNKKTIREKVLYSGYLYFESSIKLNEDEIKQFSLLPNVMGMMGDKRPILLRETDIRRILKDDDLDKHIESKKLKYIIGEKVMISDGPFNGFEAVIKEITGEKLKTEVKIFGRNTNVELTLEQIQKHQ
jgi:transcriptional antiterminator NusG